MYFYEGSNEIVWLDVDDVTSYGPETITVVDFSKVNNFKYCIHNYTDRYEVQDGPTAFALSDSGAVVEVYRGSSLLATYRVPTNRQGTVWNVFTINSSGTIQTLNTMGWESDPSAVS